MKKNALGVLLAALMLGAPLPAAAGPTYDYVEFGLASGGYNWLDYCSTDTLPYYANGYQLAGSKSIGESWFVDGRYNTLSMKVAGGFDPLGGCDPSVDLDATTMNLSAGWHGENWFAKFGYESYDYFDLPAPTGTGYALDGGYRGSLSDAIEYQAHLAYADLGDLGTAIRYGFGFSMLLGDHWGASFNYDYATYDFDYLSPFTFSETSTLGTVNIRYQW